MSLVEVVKSGVPMIVLIFGILTRFEPFSIVKFVVIGILCLGIFLTSFGEVNLHIGGLILSIIATFSGATRLIAMQRLLSGHTNSSKMVESVDDSSAIPEPSGNHSKLHPILSLAYFAPLSVASLFLPWCVLEASRFFHSDFMNRKLEIILVLCLGAVLAFCLNYVELLIIEASSALTLCVSGIIKLIFLIIVSSILFGYIWTPLNITGILLAIVGISGYNYVRFSDSITSLPFEKIANETEDAFTSE